MKFVEMTLEQARTVINGIEKAYNNLISCNVCPLEHRVCNGNCGAVIASAGMIIGRGSMRPEFEVDEPVMVRDRDHEGWFLRKYAFHTEGKHAVFFPDSPRFIVYWCQCRKLTDEEHKQYNTKGSI